MYIHLKIIAEIFRVRFVEKFVESAPATLEINIKYIMLSLWAIRLSTAATLNPRRNTHTHTHTAAHTLEIPF